MIIQTLDYYLDPIRVADHLADRSYFVFLDSSSQQNKYGTCSFIAFEPFLTISRSRGKMYLSSPQQNGEDLTPFLSLPEDRREVTHPFSTLREFMKRFKVEGLSSLPFPVGGLFGYISYDLGASLEAGIPLHQGFEDWPEMEWGLYDLLIVFDHPKKVMTLVSTGFPCSGSEQDQRAGHRLSRLLAVLEEIRSGNGLSVGTEWPPISDRDFQRSGKRDRVPFSPPGLRSNFTALTYQQAVQTIKDYITRGDVYQVNLSQQFYGESGEKGYDLYRRIRQVNQVPYGGYLHFGRKEMLCFSMERFLRMEGRHVQTRPIKGTRPRGQGGEEDKLQSLELFRSEKDRAELLMVVDMERNDLGRVCEYNSIRVDRLFEVEQYATVFHLVSTISGLLRPDFDHLDCFLACFPGGSITGTPKIRAMEIISELEKTNRGVYCGAIGYFGFNEISDFNIPIRTILKQGPDLWFNAGGGVVIDSDPHLEYLETLYKVSSFFNCLPKHIRLPA
ncbi:MAG: anthranilate synthase component I family protein [bacterium]